jgi:hypothetical protein
MAFFFVPPALLLLQALVLTPPFLLVAVLFVPVLILMPRPFPDVRPFLTWLDTWVPPRSVPDSACRAGATITTGC